MRRIVLTLLLLGVAMCMALSGTTAAASPLIYATDTTSSPSPTGTPTTDGEAGSEDGVFILLGNQSNDGSQTEDSTDGGAETTSSTSSASAPAGHWVRSTACETVGTAGCLEGYSCPDGSTPVVWTLVLDAGGNGGSYSQCPEDPPPTSTPPPVDIPGEALKAFKKVELPESTIVIQPPGGETLVNFKTILSTQAARYQVPVHLDEVNIDLLLEVWPSNFAWHHGDGTNQESTIAGAIWTKDADVDAPEFITHIYTRALKDVQVSVDTTWSAQFKVVGKPDWRPVNGTVTIDGAAVPLTVREATPELVTEPN